MNPRAGRVVGERTTNETLLMGWRKRWNQSLLRFIGCRVRVAVDIEDVAQETYLRLLRVRDLAGVRNPQGYLLRVASHVVSEWRERRPPDEMFEPVEEALLADETDLEFELEAQLSQSLLDHALEALSPVTRAVLILRFRESRPSKDIMKELDLTARQVRRHLTRGIEKLRAALVNGLDTESCRKLT